MLILTRRAKKDLRNENEGQSVILLNRGSEVIRIELLENDGAQASIGIDAESEWEIVREELLLGEL